MKIFKIDKSYGKAGKFEDFDYNRTYWLNKSIAERLQAAWFLICQAYKIDESKPEFLDKNQHQVKKHSSN
jgi:hypothetical protein